MKRIVTVALFVALMMPCAHGGLAINTDAVQRAIVFIYQARTETEPDTRAPLGTGFLLRVPSLDGKIVYELLVTARHIVDPEWALCDRRNPSVVFIRVNRSNYDSARNSTGVDYVRIPLTSASGRAFAVSQDDAIDAAVIVLHPNTFAGTEFADPNAPPAGIQTSELAAPDEAKAIGIGEPIASAGLVAGYSGEKRNYPFFKFGNVSSIPDEPVWMSCEQGKPALKQLKVWFVAANLIPGNSGSPIFYVPTIPTLSSAVQRPVLLGVQSISLGAADIAGMTPIEAVYQIIAGLQLPNANLARGKLAGGPP